MKTIEKIIFLCIILFVGYLVYNIYNLPEIMNTKIITYEKKVKNIEVKGKVYKQNASGESKQNASNNSYDEYSIILKPDGDNFVFDYDKSKLPTYMRVDEVITTTEKNYLSAIRIGWQWNREGSKLLIGYKLAHIKSVELLPYFATDFKKNVDAGLGVSYRVGNVTGGLTYDILDKQVGVAIGFKVF